MGLRVRGDPLARRVGENAGAVLLGPALVGAGLRAALQASFLARHGFGYHPSDFVGGDASDVDATHGLSRFVQIRPFKFALDRYERGSEAFNDREAGGQKEQGP